MVNKMNKYGHIIKRTGKIFLVFFIKLPPFQCLGFGKMELLMGLLYDESVKRYFGVFIIISLLEELGNMILQNMFVVVRFL